MGKHGLGKMNKEGERIVAFARANRIAILNTYFSKSSARTCTFTSGGKNTQVDYILCRRGVLKEVKDFKVIWGECSKITQASG